jgi:signal transduction histidine kinase
VPQLSELYFPVHVDPDLFGQAVINLLSNAVKYTPAGGEVRLRSRMEEDRAVIEIRDTGMGIPAESLPRIFERFYRVPQNNQAAHGTGLGLALVHYIVTELHNGAIAVDSEVNAGTCFTVSIPLGHVDPLRTRGEPVRRRREAEPCLV